MSQGYRRALLFLIVIAATTGCAYRHYLGLHGPTIRNLPEIHDVSIRDDAQCLGCHGSADNDAGAPATPHPGFRGCLNCHNDPVSR